MDYGTPGPPDSCPSPQWYPKLLGNCLVCIYLFLTSNPTFKTTPNLQNFPSPYILLILWKKTIYLQIYRKLTKKFTKRYRWTQWGQTFAICRRHNCTSFWCPITVKIIYYWFIITFRKVLWPKIKSSKIWNAMAWLSMRHGKDTILDLQMSGEPVYALGAHFTYDLEVSEKKFFFDKLGS